MKIIRSYTARLIAVGLFFAILLSGCAANVRMEEQEGGISGTGNSIDCSDERNKKRKECIGDMHHNR